MSEPSIPSSLNVPLPALTNLAVEWWRLASGAPPAGAGRHAIRRIEDFLRQCELEVQTFDGRAFDPGLAVRVIDTVDDPKLSQGQSQIEQTLSPLVLWRGQVVKTADVVVRKGAGKR